MVRYGARLILVLLICTAATVRADSAGQFFKRDVSKNIFGPEVTLVNPPKFQHLRHIPSAEEFKVSEQSVEDTAQEIENTEQEITEADIIEQFGSPDKPAPIRAQEDAPKPFQAMMMALDTDHEDLAYQYAKQYARYVQGLQSRIKRTVGLTRVAMASDGYVSEDSLGNAPWIENEMPNLFRDRELQAAQQTNENLSIDDHAKLLLEEAQEERRAALTQDFSVAPQLSRAQVRQHIRSRHVPRDPSGRVEVYAFFRPHDRRFQTMIPALNDIAAIASTDDRIKLRGMVVGDITPKGAEALQKTLGAGFKLIPGSKAASELKVQRTPSFLFLSPSTGEGVVEEGIRDQVFIEEMILAVQGKRAFRRAE